MTSVLFQLVFTLLLLLLLYFFTLLFFLYLFMTIQHGLPQLSHLKFGKENKIIPLSQWDITLTSTVSKLFHCVQLNPISQWAESDAITADERNGCRKKTCARCLIKHKYRLQRIKLFLIITDLSQAFDHTDQSILWNTLAWLVHEMPSVYVEI